MLLKSCNSIGCVDYGNNNFFEVMVDGEGKVVLCSHEEDPGEENEDGSYDSEGLSINEFIKEIEDRPDFREVLSELFVLFE